MFCVASFVSELMGDKLASMGEGVKAERIIIICPGGPGHIFFLHKQIVTAAKIAKSNDIKWYVV